MLNINFTTSRTNLRSARLRVYYDSVNSVELLLQNMTIVYDARHGRSMIIQHELVGLYTVPAHTSVQLCNCRVTAIERLRRAIAVVEPDRWEGYVPIEITGRVIAPAFVLQFLWDKVEAEGSPRFMMRLRDAMATEWLYNGVFVTRSHTVTAADVAVNDQVTFRAMFRRDIVREANDQH